ncbi:o-succinylbenzoate synthase [Lentimicrobium sp.]
MLKARVVKHQLQFKQPAGTSRGVLRHKTVYYLSIKHTQNPSVEGIGECGTIPGLSFDDRPGYHERLNQLVDEINKMGHLPATQPGEWPSIDFALETALLDLASGGQRLLFDTPFTRGERSIPINGLIWMGDEQFMLQQLEQKLLQGFKVLKMKVGALDFNTELSILKHIRHRFTAEQITIRLDANGAFTPEEAMKKLEKLAAFDIHSIEQPIKTGQIAHMAELCRHSPIPVALDEELIGVHTLSDKTKLLDSVEPQYVILKPGLLGGFAASHQWIDLARERGIGWWVTSALESNIGLNAIAQWTATLGNAMPQGLGTGSLYTNNLKSPLQVKQGALFYNNNLDWDIKILNA